NKYVPELINTFSDVMEEVKNTFLSGEKGEGAELMKKLEETYNDLCQESLEESNKMLDVLYEKKK
ncbi:MAG: hypothetical protein JRJ27_15545, partial [Deltaproteobacteria bacterium]|nr:hypothetical protein [Deltaproteobacteria bacterium]